MSVRCIVPRVTLHTVHGTLYTGHSAAGGTAFSGGHSTVRPAWRRVVVEAEGQEGRDRTTEKGAGA